MFYIVDINKYMCVYVYIYISIYLVIKRKTKFNSGSAMYKPNYLGLLNLLSLISLLNNEESTHGLTDYMLDITLGFLGTQAGMDHHNSP